MQKIYIKKTWVIGVMICTFIGSIFIITRSQAGAKEETFVVKNTTVHEEVSVTGKVVSAGAVDLSIEKSGRVTAVRKAVGERVVAGDIIVRIDNSELGAQLAQAQALVRYERAELAELETRIQTEKESESQITVEAARTDFEHARLTLSSSIQGAYTSVQNAIYNKVDQFFVTPRSANPQLAFAVTVTSEQSIESGRVEVEGRIQSLLALTQTLQTTKDIVSISNEAKKHIAEVKLFLDNAAFTVNALTANSYLSQSTVTQWKTDLELGRADVTAAMNAVLTADQKYSSSLSALARAEKQILSDEERKGVQTLEIKRAQVASAEAAVQKINALLAKTYIKAPIDGVVTKQDARLGETINPDTVIASIMSDSAFEIVAYISETDVAKVSLGDHALVRLDAYSFDTVFDARIVHIDPAETIVDGSSLYKILFQFSLRDTRIKSGMTAHIDIPGESREDVVAVPERAISIKGGKQYVTLRVDEKNTKEIEVKTGLRGSNGFVEIMNGLVVGDSVTMIRSRE